MKSSFKSSSLYLPCLSLSNIKSYLIILNIYIWQICKENKTKQELFTVPWNSICCCKLDPNLCLWSFRPVSISILVVFSVVFVRSPLIFMLLNEIFQCQMAYISFLSRSKKHRQTMLWTLQNKWLCLWNLQAKQMSILVLWEMKK